MKKVEDIKAVYFVGAGGIGMSALIRYFLSKGKVVAGYDRTPSELTKRLIEEGAQIHYEENVDLIPQSCRDKETTLVVYTPAIPHDHAELCYFNKQGFEVKKRSQVLGLITHDLCHHTLKVKPFVYILSIVFPRFLNLHH